MHGCAITTVCRRDDSEAMQCDVGMNYAIATLTALLAAVFRYNRTACRGGRRATTRTSGAVNARRMVRRMSEDPKLQSIRTRGARYMHARRIRNVKVESKREQRDACEIVQRMRNAWEGETRDAMEEGHVPGKRLRNCEERSDANDQERRDWLGFRI